MWKNVETSKVHLFPVCSVVIGHSFYFLFEKQDATKINKHSIDAENAEHIQCFGKCGKCRKCGKMWKMCENVETH